MSQPTPNLDPVSVASAVVLSLFGPAAAPYAGPYVVMMLGAFVGSLIALRRRDPAGPRTGAFWFVSALMLWSMAISIPLAETAGAWAGKDWKWALFPVSCLVAGIGESWIDVGKWAVGVWRAAIERKAQGGQS